MHTAAVSNSKNGSPGVAGGIALLRNSAAAPILPKLHQRVAVVDSSTGRPTNGDSSANNNTSPKENFAGVASNSSKYSASSGGYSITSSAAAVYGGSSGEHDNIE